MKPRIGLVSQWYDPERGAAAVPGTIARSIARQGHDVEVLTGFPNYPSGSIHSGYRLRPYQLENMQGVFVHRAPLYPSHDSHPLRRAVNYLSFAIASTPVALMKLGKVDAVLVHSSPATVAIPAIALRVARRKPFVVHIQDLWPQTVVSSGFLGERGASLVERVLHRFCDAVYKRAHTIVVTSPGMAGLIAQRGVDESKITFVPNWTDESAFKPAKRDEGLARELGITSKFTVMYAGNLGEFQNLSLVVEAATLLRDDSDIGFVFVGSGVEEESLRRMVSDRSLRNVTFVEQQPFDRMSAVLALGDVQLVSLKDFPLFRTTLPSKLQATMAAGRPIIGAVTGDAANVIRDSGAGLVVTPGSASELASAVRQMFAEPENLMRYGDAGRAHYEEHFSEAVASTKLSALLLAASRSGREK